MSSSPSPERRRALPDQLGLEPHRFLCLLHPGLPDARDPPAELSTPTRGHLTVRAGFGRHHRFHRSRAAHRPRPARQPAGHRTAGRHQRPHPPATLRGKRSGDRGAERRRVGAVAPVRQGLPFGARPGRPAHAPRLSVPATPARWPDTRRSGAPAAHPQHPASAQHTIGWTSAAQSTAPRRSACRSASGLNARCARLFRHCPSTPPEATDGSIQTSDHCRPARPSRRAGGADRRRDRAAAGGSPPRSASPTRPMNAPPTTSPAGVGNGCRGCPRASSTCRRTGAARSSPPATRSRTPATCRCCSSAIGCPGTG